MNKINDISLVKPRSLTASDDLDSFLSTDVSFGIICRGPFKDAQTIIDYIRDWTASIIRYQRKGLRKLIVSEATP